ncbi:hypothetical protein [Yeosuana marina]|uniref:hypothetical protein n=1 Tax=Yeosuana marina TaxID=1565536 RepID=UPI0014240FE8|nr:hypothetical protein [Yeosuana marina]
MKDLIFFEKTIALLSFLIGTALLSIYLYFGNPNTIKTVGLYFVITAFIINSLLFFINLIGIIIDNKNRVELIKTCGIMLLNIPIAILYLYMIISIIFSPKF